MLYSKNKYSHFIVSQNAHLALFKLIQCTNLDIKDTSCLHIVHILQHPTSCPKTKSRQTTMVITLRKNFSPLPVGKSDKSRKCSIERRHHVHEWKSGLDAERVRAFGAWHSLRCKRKLVVQQQRETHFLSYEEKENWIKDCVERETAVARKQVEDAETVIKQEQEYMRKAENEGLTTRQPTETYQERMFAIGDSLCDLESSDDSGGWGQWGWRR